MSEVVLNRFIICSIKPQISQILIYSHNVIVAIEQDHHALIATVIQFLSCELSKAQPIESFQRFTKGYFDGYYRIDKLVRLIDQYHHCDDHDLYLSSYCIIAIKSNASPSKYPLVELWKAHRI